MKKLGKIGKINKKANAILKKRFMDAGYTEARCEIQLEKCMQIFAISYAHRHKRKWYRSRPELLSELNQVVLACPYCHDRIEYDEELTKEVFLRLRGEEVL